jgi:hypothetical protein
MARLVVEATGAEQATVWLRLGDLLQPQARWPPTGQPPDAIALDAHSLEALVESQPGSHVRGGPVTDGSLASGAFYRPSLIEEDLDAPIIQRRRCPPREPPDQRWNGLGQHLVRDRQRLRRRRLQAKRSRPPARRPRARGLPGDQNLRPLRATRG